MTWQEMPNCHDIRRYGRLLRSNLFRYRAFCFLVTGSDRPPIGQPLALDAGQRDLGAIDVVKAERDAVVVAEVELGEVAVQVLLATCW